MTSFTSRSERQIPWRAAKLLAGAALAWLAVGAYTMTLNPEVRYFRRAADIKRARVAALEAAGEGKVVFCGGSACGFSVDGLRLAEQHGIPAVNMGMHAGMGAWFLTAFAIDAAQAGDTLVFMMEPGLLTAPISVSALGAQMSMVLGDPGLMTADTLTGLGRSWFAAGVRLRPGAYHAFTMIGKLVGGKPLYRYRPEDIAADGLMSTDERRALGRKGTHAGALSPDGRHLVVALAAWAKANNVTLVYALPWQFVFPERMSEARKANRRLLDEISRSMPVLEPRDGGVMTNAAWFADTRWHLTEESRALRTDDLADGLRPFRSRSAGSPGGCKTDFRRTQMSLGNGGGTPRHHPPFAARDVAAVISSVLARGRPRNHLQPGRGVCARNARCRPSLTNARSSSASRATSGCGRKVLSPAPSCPDAT